MASVSKQHFRTTVVPIVLLVTFGAVLLVGALFGPTESGQLGGDFPAFYAAGDIVAEQGYDNLYDPATQRDAQQGLIENEGGYLFFAYPPFVATGYSLVSPLGYRVAYLIQMALMGAAAVATVFLLRPMSRYVDRYPWLTVAAVVLFQPLTASIVGGQNTALTLLLIAVAARLEWSGKPVLAGVAAGLLAYKPQYGVPLAILYLISRNWPVLRGLVPTWIGLYAVGALAQGAGWVGPWWRQAASFRDINASVNGWLFVSLPGYIEHLSGVSPTVGRVISLVIGAGGMLLLSILWRRADIGIAEKYSLAAIGLIMIAPQSLFYEAGVAAAPLLLLADRSRRIRLVGGGVWGAGWLYALTASQLNTTVLVFALAVVASVVAALVLARKSTVGVEAAV